MKLGSAWTCPRPLLADPRPGGAAGCLIIPPQSLVICWLVPGIMFAARAGPAPGPAAQCVTSARRGLQSGRRCADRGRAGPRPEDIDAVTALPTRLSRAI